jgi:hypothetical protein
MDVFKCPWHHAAASWYSFCAGLRYLFIYPSKIILSHDQAELGYLAFFQHSRMNQMLSNVSTNNIYLCTATNVLFQTLTGYLSKSCPEEYHAHMIPKHCESYVVYIILKPPTRPSAPGCKRIMIDSNYLSALSRPNLTPNFDGISKITENGILTNKGS